MIHREDEMKTWKIESKAGVDMGTYRGKTEQDALDAMARDAGYASQAEAEEVLGPFKGTVTEESDR